MGAGLAILCGTLVVGTLDALDAIVFFGMRGATPVRIFQSIAAGLLGRSAFQGGHRTAALGVALHYLIAFLIVLVFYFVSRRLRFVTDHAIVSGLAYGVAVYFTMNYLVIPMSAAAQGPFSLPVFVNGILIHMFGVGLPAALFARMAR
jgi:uncharacterized membrane protein YagU involved in acid resistance